MGFPSLDYDDVIFDFPDKDTFSDFENFYNQIYLRSESIYKFTECYCYYSFCQIYAKNFFAFKGNGHFEVEESHDFIGAFIDALIDVIKQLPEYFLTEVFGNYVLYSARDNQVRFTGQGFSRAAKYISCTNANRNTINGYPCLLVKLFKSADSQNALVTELNKYLDNPSSKFDSASVVALLTNLKKKLRLSGPLVDQAKMASDPSIFNSATGKKLFMDITKEYNNFQINVKLPKPLTLEFPYPKALETPIFYVCLEYKDCVYLPQIPDLQIYIQNSDRKAYSVTWKTKKVRRSSWSVLLVHHIIIYSVEENLLKAREQPVVRIAQDSDHFLAVCLTQSKEFSYKILNGVSDQAQIAIPQNFNYLINKTNFFDLPVSTYFVSSANGGPCDAFNADLRLVLTASVSNRYIPLQTDDPQGLNVFQSIYAFALNPPVKYTTELKYPYILLDSFYYIFSIFVSKILSASRTYKTSSNLKVVAENEELTPVCYLEKGKEPTLMLDFSKYSDKTVLIEYTYSLKKEIIDTVLRVFDAPLTSFDIFSQKDIPPSGFYVATEVGSKKVIYFLCQTMNRACKILASELEILGNPRDINISLKTPKTEFSSYLGTMSNIYFMDKQKRTIVRGFSTEVNFGYADYFNFFSNCYKIERDAEMKKSFVVLIDGCEKLKDTSGMKRFVELTNLCDFKREFVKQFTDCSAHLI